MAFEWLAQVFLGFFIGGVIVTIIMMILSGVSISHGMDAGAHADTSTDITTEASTDVTTDAHVEFDSAIDGHDAGSSDVGHDFSSHDMGTDSTGIEGGHDFSSHEISHDSTGYESGHDVSSHDMSHDNAGHEMSQESAHEFQAHGSGDYSRDGRGLDSQVAVNLNVHGGTITSETGLISSDKGQKAPFLLLFSGFLMFSGALGLMFFGLMQISIFLLFGIAFIPPFLLNKALGKLWQKITKSETYLIPAELPLIGQKVRVVMPVDASGGEVRIDASSSPFGAQRLPVMPLYQEKTFGQGEEIYICDYSLIKGVKFFLVDDDPSEIRKTKQVQV
jgi:hypothetical protein